MFKKRDVGHSPHLAALDSSATLESITWVTTTDSTLVTQLETKILDIKMPTNFYLNWYCLLTKKVLIAIYLIYKKISIYKYSLWKLTARIFKVAPLSPDKRGTWISGQVYYLRRKQWRIHDLYVSDWKEVPFPWPCGYASLLEGNNQGAVLKIPSIESIPISWALAMTFRNPSMT